MQWNDLDYAYKRRVFTFDPGRFKDLPEMVEEFHTRGLKYILILVGTSLSSVSHYRSSSSRWRQIWFVTESCPGFCLRIQASAAPAHLELTLHMRMD